MFAQPTKKHMKCLIGTLLGAGILVANVILGTADVHAKKPRPPIFPPIDPSRVDCTAFRTGNEEQCYRTANEVYQLNLLILSEYEAGDFASAGQDVLPNTPQMFPDGTVIYGVGPENFPVCPCRQQRYHRFRRCVD
jgi:hypothetical protein